MSPDISPAPHAMRNRRHLPMGALALALASTLPSIAQQAAPAANPGAENETVVLSPFVVSANSDVGYEARETMGGTRLATQLKDVASQVTVFTPEFLQDMAITNLNDAMLYSLNTETDAEVIPVAAPGTAGIEATSRPFGGGGRTRGIGPSNRAHDFFDTIVPIDAYNTERFTFASGPNSILFGNANPSGTIDTSFKRAKTERARTSVELMFDDNGSNRQTLDINQPVVPNVLAIRFAGLRDRTNNWRAPAFRNDTRGYGSVVLKPFKNLTLTGYYERTSIHDQPVRNTLVQDHVTPWLNGVGAVAGGTAYNNKSGGALPGAGTATPFLARGAANPYYAFDYHGGVMPVFLGANTVVTRGYDSVTPAPNNFEHSIVDESLYPRDLAYSGNADQAKYNTWIRGAIMEFNPLKNLFFELGANDETFRHRGVDLWNNAAAELNIDTNLYLADRVTPNPNYGRYTFESTVPIVVKNVSTKKQRRASVAYELDFTQKDNWMKWLGRHRFAGILDHLENVRIFQRSDFRVVGDYSFTSPTNANTRVLRQIYYVDPEHMTIDVPYDPLADGQIALPGGVDANGKQVYIAAWDPAVTPTGAETERFKIGSSVLAMQNFFLDGRIATAFGERRDHVRVYSGVPGARTIDDLTNNGLPWNEVNDKTPVTRLKSIVVHPLSWLSLSYVKSDSEQIAANIKYNLDGTSALLGAGAGDEYGITLNWKNKLSLRVAKYEDSSIGSSSSLRLPNPVPTIPGRSDRGNIIRIDVTSIEKTIYGETFPGSGVAVTTVPSAVLSDKYAAFQQAIATGFDWTGTAGGGVQDTWDLLSDRTAKGYEVTLVGNPTPNLRLSITAAKNQTRESNVGPQYFEFVQERLPVWTNYLTLKSHAGYDATGNVTIKDMITAVITNLNYIRLAAGQRNVSEREYRVISTARYSFSEGLLKGSFIGANYSWRSAAAVGYQPIVITDNPYIVPGVVSNTITVPDITQPIYGKALVTFDMFGGYNRRLFKGKVDWRIQLNVRNVFDKQDLILQRAQSDGTGVIFTPQAPRSFILTNTFSF